MSVNTSSGKMDGSLAQFIAAAAYTPQLAPDPSFGGPQQPAVVDVRVRRQRAVDSGRKRTIRLRVDASEAGLVLLRVRDARGRLLGGSLQPVHRPGATTMLVPLTSAGTRRLRGARRGLRISVRHEFRDILAGTDKGVTRGRGAERSSRRVSAALVVMAKAPVAGRSKTRLCPPLEPAQAATLAEAALADTLQAVVWTPADRRVLVLDGEPGPWLPPGFELFAQRGDGLGERLGNAVGDVGGPLIMLGMDTPQVTRALLGDALERLEEPSIDAVLGPTADGGYWAIGLADPDRSVFDGVPMSTARTGPAQRARLEELGLRTTLLQTLHDVDTFDDARTVAALAPWTRFAATLELLGEPPADFG